MSDTDNQSQILCNTTFLEQYRGLLEGSMSNENNPDWLVERVIHHDPDFFIKDTETNLCTEEWGSLESLNNLNKDLHLLGKTFPIFQ